jgi:hypothetical protein
MKLLLTPTSAVTATGIVDAGCVFCTPELFDVCVKDPTLNQSEPLAGSFIPWMITAGSTGQRPALHKPQFRPVIASSNPYVLFPPDLLHVVGAAVPVCCQTQVHAAAVLPVYCPGVCLPYSVQAGGLVEHLVPHSDVAFRQQFLELYPGKSAAEAAEYANGQREQLEILCVG